MSRASDAAALLLESIESDLEGAWARLGEEGREIKADLQKTLTLSMEVAILKGMGEDVALSEQAIATALQAIRARGALAGAREVRAAWWSSINKILGTAFTLLTPLDD